MRHRLLRRTPLSPARAVLGTACGFAAGIAAAAAIAFGSGEPLVKPITVTARDCRPTEGQAASAGDVVGTGALAARDGRTRSEAEGPPGDQWFCAEPEALAAAWHRQAN